MIELFSRSAKIHHVIHAYTDTRRDKLNAIYRDRVENKIGYLELSAA